MTDDDLRPFKTLYTKWCQLLIQNHYCVGDCGMCSLEKAYQETQRLTKADGQIDVHIYNIKWDTDGEEVELPSEVDWAFDGYIDINDEELVDEIEDWLSDEYGYCTEEFQLRENKE